MSQSELAGFFKKLSTDLDDTLNAYMKEMTAMNSRLVTVEKATANIATEALAEERANAIDNPAAETKQVKITPNNVVPLLSAIPSSEDATSNFVTGHLNDAPTTQTGDNDVRRNDKHSNTSLVSNHLFSVSSSTTSPILTAEPQPLRNISEISALTVSTMTPAQPTTLAPPPSTPARPAQLLLQAPGPRPPSTTVPIKAPYDGPIDLLPWIPRMPIFFRLQQIPPDDQSGRTAREDASPPVQQDRLHDYIAAFCHYAITDGDSDTIDTNGARLRGLQEERQAVFADASTSREATTASHGC